MKSLFLFFLLAAFPAPSGDVSGVWKLDGMVEDHPVNPTCTFKQTAEKISGSCKFEQNTEVQPADLTGTVNGKDITWKFSVDYEGTNYTLTFSGKLDSDTSIKGTIAVDPSDSSGEFTAKKQ